MSEDKSHSTDENSESLSKTEADDEIKKLKQRVAELTTEKNNPFVVKMDREGLVENDAFLHLVEMIRLSLDWMTLHYEKQKIQDKKKREEKARREFEEAIGSKGKSSDDTFDNALQYLEKAAKTIEDSNDEPNKQKKTDVKPSKTSSSLEIGLCVPWILSHSSWRDSQFLSISFRKPCRSGSTYGVCL